LSFKTNLATVRYTQICGVGMVWCLIGDIDIYLHEEYTLNLCRSKYIFDIVTLSTNLDLNMANIGSLERVE
jgi:hypothetical protein